MNLTPLELTAAALAATMVALWAVSLPLRNASIADGFWGLGFVGVAGVAFAREHAAGPRPLLALALVSAWGLRLAAHLISRNHGKGEDPRYAAMRSKAGEKFWITSLFTVFVLQGALLWVISLPVQLAITRDAGPLGLFDGLGVALWIVGFLFEAVGDAQLRRFRADPSSRGRVLDTGLWRYTRHPNYFGDATLWWGLGCLALPGAPWVLVSPVLMSFFLRSVSGVPMLERDMAQRRPGYAEYVRRTSAFFPRPPGP